MYYNEPVEEQKCPKGCVDGGPGKSDYCGGQSLFNQNEKLSQCADHQYKEGVKIIRNAKTELARNQGFADLYTLLLSCTGFFANLGSNDPKYKKDLRALTADLIGEYKKAKKPVDKYYADAREEWREL
ncbi:hypothetical protein N7492_001145 [Penicillium capsulatum]|uniref:Uncharacterized protein n=1 Tax=Penicillium capsulatum TaxID=69766 RepID=A0A9W9IT51_9EURO|nr:hypothetical protein N7492_001145 [Penicillium capsulatum]